MMSGVKMDQYQVIAYYPYCYNTNLYHGLIQEMISEKYFVIDYNDLRNGHLPLGYIDVIYLNWIEDNMGELEFFGCFIIGYHIIERLKENVRITLLFYWTMLVIL